MCSAREWAVLSIVRLLKDIENKVTYEYMFPLTPPRPYS